MKSTSYFYDGYRHGNEKTLGHRQSLTEKGSNLYTILKLLCERVRFLRLDKEYVVKNGEIVIVDEFTGRLQPGGDGARVCTRQLRLECDRSKESRTFASIRIKIFQALRQIVGHDWYRQKPRLKNFTKVYGLDVARFRPTALLRLDRNDLIYQPKRAN